MPANYRPDANLPGHVPTPRPAVIPKDCGPFQRRLCQVWLQDPNCTIEQLASRVGRSVPVTRNAIRRLSEQHGFTITVQPTKEAN